MQLLQGADDIPRRLDLHVAQSTALHQDLGGGGRLVTFKVHAPEGFTFKSAQVYLTPRIGAPRGCVRPIGRQIQSTGARPGRTRFQTLGLRARPAKRHSKMNRPTTASGRANTTTAVATATASFDWMTCCRERTGACCEREVLARTARCVFSIPMRKWSLLRRRQAGLIIHWNGPTFDSVSIDSSTPEDTAPDFDFAGFDGNRVRLSAYRGQACPYSFLGHVVRPMPGSNPVPEMG